MNKKTFRIFFFFLEKFIYKISQSGKTFISELPRVFILVRRLAVMVHTTSAWVGGRAHKSCRFFIVWVRFCYFRRVKQAE